ncbi:MAG TPA: SpaA isopeptide-forming pilin-related protein [Actinomycetota bacterium]|jgi:uncharacterized repeat protein (TIGR01451 family)
MKRFLSPAGGRRSRRSLLGILVSALLLGLFVVPAQAVHDLGLFELDRNAQDTDFANLPDDWAALYDGGANTGAHSDDFSGVLPDIGADGGTQFQGGGSKDDLDITSWLWKAGEPLDKDDITNAYAAAYTNTVDTGNNDVGDLIIYFGLDRFSTAGSAQVGFWFLQDPAFGLTQTASGGGFKFSGQHVDGDVLVQSNFTNGGVISNLAVFQWQSGALVPVAGVPSPSECNPASPAPPLADDAACATVNQSATASPWPYTPKANEGPSGTFQTSAFFEGGINISRLIEGAGCFTAFTAETRSSTPFDARLKDFVIGNLDTCVRDVSVAKSPDGGTANAGDPISFTIVVTNESPNSDADNVTLTDTLPDSGLNWSITSQPVGDPCSISGTPQVLNCNFGTLGVGEDRTVTISSPTDAEDCGLIENTVTVSADGDIDLTNNSDDGDITVNCGALRILKQSTKTGNPLVANAGTEFAVTGPSSFSVTDNGATDEDPDVGEVCVSGLAAGEYTVSETTPPDGYGDGTATDPTALVVTGTDCTDNQPLDANSAVFTNPPLADIQVNFRDGGSGETSATIDCEPPAGTDTPDDPATAGWDTSVTHEGLTPGTYVCTVVIDP